VVHFLYQCHSGYSEGWVTDLAMAQRTDDGRLLGSTPERRVPLTCDGVQRGFDIAFPAHGASWVPGHAFVTISIVLCAGCDSEGSAWLFSAFRGLRLLSQTR
jgi:hypothetical protein